jgi:hypothetical protein
MSTKKKVDAAPAVMTPVDTYREDLRVFGEGFGNPDAKTNWLSPEFVTLAGTVLTNVVGVMVLIGWVDAEGASELTKAIVACVGAVQTIAVNSALVWKYLAGKAEEKVKAAELRASYLQSVQVARIRAEYDNRW